MLYKFLVLCLFTTICTVIGMDDSSSSRIPWIPAAAVKVIEAKKRREKHSEITQKSAHWGLAQPTHEEKEEEQYSEKDDADSDKPLVWSDMAKSTVIKALFEFPRICPTSGNTILHYAATLPQIPNLITLVLEKNPDLKKDIDHRNKQGFSPYILALMKNNEAGAQILKDHGANLDWPKKMYFPDLQKTISVEQP